MTRFLLLIIIAGCFGTKVSAQQDHAALLQVNYPALISRADLNYTVPVKRSEEGLPVGNGRMGSLVWTNSATLKMQINRVDVFGSNSSSNNFFQRNTDYCGGTGFVEVNFGENIFTPQNFQQHLYCYDGFVSVAGKGIKAKVLAWNKKDVMAVQVQDNRIHRKPVRIDLRMLRPPVVTKGSHTAVSKISTKGDKIILTQAFKEDDYYCGSAVVIGTTGNAKAILLNDTTVSLSLTGSSTDFSIYIASAAGFDPREDFVNAAIEKLMTAQKEGFEKLLAFNKAWWHRYWSKAFIHLHSDDGVADEVEKNYTYYLYVMGASSLGKYPPKFNGMLWTTDGDRRKWGSAYWGANQSCLYNALFPTNRMALTDPMFDMYSGMYEKLSTAAWQQWGSKGIYIPETIAFNGPEKLPDDIAKEMRQLYLLQKPWEERSQRFKIYANTKSPYLSRWNWKNRGKWENGEWVAPDRGAGPYGPVTHIFSRGAKIAYQYWQRYEYTLDTAWLRERAYPMIKGIAEFYRNFPNVKKEKDGRYHIYHINDNEPVWDGHNTVEEISAMKGIFPVVIKASEILGVDENMRSLWQEFLDHLSSLPLSTAYHSLANNDEATWVKSLPPVVHGRGEALPDPNTLPVWFFDLCNPGTDNVQMLETANATFDAYFRNGINEKTRIYVLSRLSVAGTILGRVDATRYLIPNQLHSAEIPSLSNRMDEREGYQTTGVERLGRISEALQNALCQSAPSAPGGEPVIRVFPAWPKTWNAQYTLLGRNNFLITSSIQKGKIRFVEIESKKGATCRIINPWPGHKVSLYNRNVKIQTLEGELLEFDTRENDRLIIVIEGSTPEKFRKNIL